MGLKSALAPAISQEKAVIATAIPTLEVRLSSDARAVWSTARTNAGVPSAYRYVPNLTAEQAGTLSTANSTRARRLVSAKTTAARSEATATFQTTESRTLTYSQTLARDAAKTSIHQNMPGVLKASEKVLPLPEEFKPKTNPDEAQPPTP